MVTALVDGEVLLLCLRLRGGRGGPDAADAELPLPREGGCGWDATLLLDKLWI